MRRVGPLCIYHTMQYRLDRDGPIHSRVCALGMHAAALHGASLGTAVLCRKCPAHSFLAFPFCSLRAHYGEQRVLQ